MLFVERFAILACLVTHIRSRLEREDESLVNIILLVVSSQWTTNIPNGKTFSIAYGDGSASSTNAIADTGTPLIVGPRAAIIFSIDIIPSFI